MHKGFDVVVVCNGQLGEGELTKKLLSESAHIVAADGGANRLLHLGFSPEVIIGDFDSIATKTRQSFTKAQCILRDSQDQTDLEKALTWVEQQGWHEVAILGMAGKRVDFTLCNFATLWQFYERMNITVVGDAWRAIPIHGHFKFKATLGSLASIIPFGQCEGISLEGFKYSLSNATLKVGQFGVSNVVTSPSCCVEVQRGCLLLIIYNDPQAHVD